MSTIAQPEEIEIVPRTFRIAPACVETIKRDFGLDVKREMIACAFGSPMLDIAIQLRDHGLASKDEIIKVLEEEFGIHGEAAAHAFKQED